MRIGDVKMPKWGYSVIDEMLNQEKTAKASGRELKVSHKASREVCHAIKGMMLTDARQYLRDVQAKRKSIPYMRYNKKLPHRHGQVNSFSGRYPIKACGVILNVLQSAQANAENKSLDVDRLRIIHAAAYQGIKLKRYKPRAQGRSSPKFDTTTHVEIVLDEKPTSGEK
jgi:large subunit ribosomal protein L22